MVLNRDDYRVSDTPGLNLQRAGLISLFFALCRDADSRLVNYPFYRLMDCEVMWSRI